MKTTSLTISKTDFDFLKTHLERSGSNLSDYNKNQLISELDNANVLDEKDVPEDVVSLYSVAEIENIKTGQKYSFQLVTPADANMKKNKVSVFAPIGIALIGYRTGDEIKWEMPGGIQSFKILKVSRETES